MGVSVFRTFSAVLAAGALLALGVAPASAQGPAEALVTVSCVTDTADVVSVDVPASATAAAIRELPRENSCDVAAVDGVAHIAEANDTSRDLQYALDNVSFEDAWASADGTGVTVAVIDTGVESSHPDLVDRVLPGRDYVGLIDFPWTATDPHGHGTHVAGIMGANANNSLGIAGAAPGISILPVRVMNESGSGTFSNIAAGIEWAIDQGADVINMSLGSATNSPLIASAVTKALAANVVVVAAAGNDLGATAFYPASLEGVVSVAATTSTNTWASFSNYGPAVSVSAPGDNIYSTYKGATYAYSDGTSMATPFVSAEAALIREAQPSLTPAEIKALIESSATDLTTAPATVGRDDYTGAGLINPSQALCSGLCTPAPVVTSLTPTTGTTAGGTSVTITGTGFTGATAVTFGGTSATSVTVVSSTSITAKTPAHAAGLVPVAVTTPSGTGSLTNAYTFAAPVTPPPSGGGESAPAPSTAVSTGTPDHAITEVRPAFGPIGGGTTILVIGYGFTGATEVTIGGRLATSFRYIDSNTVEVVTPPGEPGWQRLIIDLPIGDAKATFNYQETPPVTTTPVINQTPTTPAVSVLAPAAVKVSSSAGKARLSWTNRSPVAPVKAYVTVFSHGKAVKRVTITPVASRAVIRGLEVGSSYRFAVTQVGSDGIAARSPITRLVRIAR